MAVILKRTAELLPLVMPYAPECPDFLAEQQLRFAAIELAERSRAWRHVASVNLTQAESDALLVGEIDLQEYGLVFTVGSDVFSAVGSFSADHLPPEVSLPAPSAAVIHEIEFASFAGKNLTPVQFSTLGKVQDGRPQYITQVAPNALTVFPFSPGPLTVSMFLKPSSASEFGTDPHDPMFDRFNVVPDFFITLHGHALALGALYRILSIPGEPWTDVKKAMIYKAEFEAKLNAAFRWNMRGQQRAAIRTTYRDF